MKNLIKHLILIFLIFCFLTVTYNLFIKDRIIENMDLKKRRIILLGDSVFDNRSYVGETDSIHYLLDHHNIIKSTIIASDGAKIANLNNQLQSVKKDLLNKKITLFISVGGNDIYDYNKTDNCKDYVDKIFDKYTTIINNYSFNCKLVLCNIYTPTSEKNTTKAKCIKIWNNKLSEYCLQNSYTLFPLDSILNKPSDFTDKIEPSKTGGRKIVNELLTYVD